MMTEKQDRINRNKLEQARQLKRFCSDVTHCRECGFSQIVEADNRLICVKCKIGCPKNWDI